MNSNLIELKNDIILTPIGGVIVGRSLIFSERYSRGIWSYDFETQESIILGENTGEEDVNMCSEIVRVGDRVYFIPFTATKMSILDLNDMKIRYIELPDEIQKSEGHFYCGVEQDMIIYLFGYDHNKVYGYDTQKNTFYKLQWDKSSSSKSDGLEGLFVRSAVCWNGMVYAVSINNNSIYVIDTDDMLMNEIVLSANNIGYSGICVYKEELILIPRNGDVFVRYNIKTGEEQYIDADLSGGEWSYNGGAVWNNYLIAIPCYGDFFVRINLENNAVDHLEKYFDDNGNNKVEYACGMPLLDNDTLIVSYLNKRFLVSLNLNSWDKGRRKTVIKTNKINRLENERIVHETEVNSLDRFIKSL